MTAVEINQKDNNELYINTVEQKKKKNDELVFQPRNSR